MPPANKKSTQRFTHSSQLRLLPRKPNGSMIRMTQPKELIQGADTQTTSWYEKIPVLNWHSLMNGHGRVETKQKNYFTRARTNTNFSSGTVITRN